MKTLTNNQNAHSIARSLRMRISMGIMLLTAITGMGNAQGLGKYVASADLTCDPKKAPQILTQTPPWVHATVGIGKVDPEVCMGKQSSLFGDTFKNAGKVVLTGGAIYLGGRLIIDAIKKPKK